MSGRRRNFQPEQTRIDIRPVLIKGQIQLQLMSNDGRQTTTKNYVPKDLDVSSLLQSGFANILVEHTQGSMTIQKKKKQEALV
ncbi:MAG: methyltransferase, partial [Actinobacteria bacterium]|nr:methyltransferase [Actinomycetota bacterium]